MSRQGYHISILWQQLHRRSYFVRDLGVEKSYSINPSYPSPSLQTVHMKKGGWEDKELGTLAISSLFVRSYSHCTAGSFLQSALSWHSALMSRALDSPSPRIQFCVYLLKSLACCLAVLGCLFKAHSRGAVLRGTTNCLASKKQNGWKPGFTELCGRAPVVYELKPGSFSHDVPINWTKKKKKGILYVKVRHSRTLHDH